jgi:hypothetical protein
MEFRSKINYLLVVARVIFITACLFFLALSFSSFAFSKNLFANILIKIIAAIGMFWGIYVTIRGLIFRTKTIVITNNQIIISELTRDNKKIYSIRDIKAIVAGLSYDMGLSNYSKAIKLEFKNGDTYEFIEYDYLNFGKMKTAFNELKKISEKSFI